MAEQKKRIYEAQERYVKKNRASERTRVNVWVPEGRAADELKAIAKEMRAGTWFDEEI